MKLAEILPEIERGRKFKLRGKNTWLDKNTRFAAFSPCHLLDDDWELEPEPEKREMWAIALDNLIADEKGEIHFHLGTKPPQPQRRALAHAIRNLLKEFEGETE